MRGKSPPPLRNMTKTPWKALGLTLLLTISGIIFLSVGVAEYFRWGLYEAFPYLLLGTLVAIPGGVYLFVFLAAFRRWPGYTYDMIPDLD